MIPCPRGCGNQIRYKGPNHTPARCRQCFNAELRSDPELRRRMVAQAAEASRARAERRVKREAERRETVDLMSCPMGHLWFPRERVFEYVYTEVGETVRMELSKHSKLAARWDTWRSRPWLRFDQVDELLCVLGLWVGDLGDPVYSDIVNKYPALEPV